MEMTNYTNARDYLNIEADKGWLIWIDTLSSMGPN